MALALVELKIHFPGNIPTWKPAETYWNQFDLYWARNVTLLYVFLCV